MAVQHSLGNEKWDFKSGPRRATPTVLSRLTSSEDIAATALSVLVDDYMPDSSREALYAYARSVSDAQQRAAGIAYLVLCSPEFQLV